MIRAVPSSLPGTSEILGSNLLGPRILPWLACVAGHRRGDNEKERRSNPPVLCTLVFLPSLPFGYLPGCHTGYSLAQVHNKLNVSSFSMSLLLMALVLGQKHWHHLLVFSEAILDCLSVVVLVPGLLGELVFPKHFCSPKVHNKFITLCYKKNA